MCGCGESKKSSRLEIQILELLTYVVTYLPSTGDHLGRESKLFFKKEEEEEMDLYAENYKTLMKEIKDDTNR